MTGAARREPRLGADFWVMAVAAAVVETILLALLVHKVVGLGLFGATHCAVVLAMAGWCRLNRTRSAVACLLCLAATTTMAAPGAWGALGAGLALLLFRRRATSFEDWYASLFPTEAESRALALYRRLEAGQEGVAASSSLTAFVDILRLGTPEQKEAVVTILSRNFRPAFAPALRLALQDAVPSVRVQAATAAAEIENDFLARSIALRREIEARPDDVEAHVQLASFYDDYSYSGMLDPLREEENRRLALVHYREALKRRPGDLALEAAVGRCLVRSGDVARAERWIARSLRRGLDDRALFVWYLDCLFALRRFDELRDLIGKNQAILLGDGQTRPGDPVPASVQLWLAEEKAA
ncbi:MAG: hypothetical protein J0H82_00425 [Alphaproteobacteria bacterium]|jgi:tetratricopeptide (TPR) repeat protein|nr:hypothetical protein [Alphaproteobacteria bacterium]